MGSALKKEIWNRRAKEIPRPALEVESRGAVALFFLFCSPFLLVYSNIPRQQITTEHKNKVTSIGFLLLLQHEMPLHSSAKPLASNNENLGTILCKHISCVMCYPISAIKS